MSLGFQREIDNHDAIFLDDADKENDADKCNDRQWRIGDLQGQKCSESSGRQGRDDRERMSEALVENPEHNIHGGKRAENQ